MTGQEYSRIKALGMNMLSASKEHGVEDAEESATSLAIRCVMAENSRLLKVGSRCSVRDEGASLNLALSATVPLQEDGQGGVHATFTLQEDQWAYFVLETAQEQDIAPPPRSPENYKNVITFDTSGSTTTREQGT